MEHLERHNLSRAALRLLLDEIDPQGRSGTAACIRLHGSHKLVKSLLYLRKLLVRHITIIDSDITDALLLFPPTFFRGLVLLMPRALSSSYEIIEQAIELYG